jgi:hypothetical protein
MTDNDDWVEILKIQQLIYRYFDAVNRADLTAMRAVYADDVVWEIPLMGYRQESADAYIEFFRGMTAGAEFMIMMPHCPVIQLLDADSARATTTVHEITRGTAIDDGPFGPKGTQVSLSDVGIYYDDISRINGSWKFTHRVFVPIYLETDGLTGVVGAERAGLLHPPTT